MSVALKAWCFGCKTMLSIDLFYIRPKASSGRSARCKSCITKISKKHWADNKGKPASAALMRSKRAYAERNRAAIKLASKQHQIKYRELHPEVPREWRKKNKERLASYVRMWSRKNREKTNAWDARRRAVKLNAAVPWANKFFIREVYDLARLRTKVMGFKWHVDHIVPLQSSLVCGLHVEQNLQVIPGIYNSSKGNRVWPDMP